MAVVSLDSWTIYGAQAYPVKVEANISNGLPCFTLVGLAETAVKEARERVRAAIQNCGLEFPTNKRITVNLAPADLPKESGRFDLPIALAILAANGQLDLTQAQQYAASGELSLTGQLRPIQGALLLSLAWLQANKATTAQPPALLLPTTSASQAAIVNSVPVYQAANLLQIVTCWQAPTNQPTKLHKTVAPAIPMQVNYPFDYSEVRGQQITKRALEIAAVGGHSVLMVGPPGSGKSMLAQRFASILPSMTEKEALESAALLSLTNKFKLHQWRQRPFYAPHHSASTVALIGGGSPPKPGEISLAHQGVLFLDELPEFSRASLEALREPLEIGSIRIARANHSVSFPARFQLIAAMNPCPCGYHGGKIKPCHCGAEQVSRYQKKLSGPLLDRIDLIIEVDALEPQQLLADAPTTPSESSSQIKQRVCRARDLSLSRQGYINANLTGEQLTSLAKLEKPAKNLLQQAASNFTWSARSIHRIIRVARSIADLAASDNIKPNHLAEAIQYRRALHSNILN